MTWFPSTIKNNFTLKKNQVGLKKHKTKLFDGRKMPAERMQINQRKKASLVSTFFPGKNLFFPRNDEVKPGRQKRFLNGSWFNYCLPKCVLLVPKRNEREFFPQNK